MKHIPGWALFLNNLKNTIKGLLTECEVCTGNYLPDRVSNRATKERAKKKNRTGKYFPQRTDIYYMAFGSFSFLFIAHWRVV